MTGSVPDGRTRIRPRSPKRAVASAIAFATAGFSSGRPPLKRTLRNTCGTGSNRRQTSLAGLPSFCTTASTCIAATRPSPVVE
jgi:hypothetical protein